MVISAHDHKSKVLVIEINNFLLDYKHDFNIHLILIGARNAYLFEKNDYASLLDANMTLLQMKINYPQLIFTPDPLCPKNHTFIHIKELPELKSHTDIGKLLDYTCPSDDFHKHGLRYIIRYCSNNVNVFTEFSHHMNKIISDNITEKIMKWNLLIKKPYHEITFHIDKVDDYLNRNEIKNRNDDYITTNWNDYSQEMDDYGLIFFSKYLQQIKPKTIVFDEQTYKFLDFMYYFNINIPYTILFPLSVDHQNIIEKGESLMAIKFYITGSIIDDFLKPLQELVKAFTNDPYKEYIIDTKFLILTQYVLENDIKPIIENLSTNY